MTLPLYDFQKTGAEFMKSKIGSLLADEPGLGKTIQTIAAVQDSDHVLIFCPKSLMHQWRNEILKWTDDGARLVTGDKKARAAAWQHDLPKYVIANYELLVYDRDIMSFDFDAIVCDEATFIANPKAQRTRALKCLKTKKKIALTGTPIKNSPVDLYSILDWLQPNVLGNYWAFLNRYCVREPRFNRIVGYKNLPALAAIADRFMLRRTKGEVFSELPAKTVVDVSFDLSDNERELYEDIRLEIVDNLAGGLSKNLGIAPVKMLRLLQCTDDARLVGFSMVKSSKLEAMRSILDPIIASGDKTIIFTKFAEMAKLLQGEIESSFLISGEVNAEERQRIVNDFNERPGADVLIMTSAGEFGLNLQSANYIIHYDLPYSLSAFEQRNGRAHRIGQTKPVTIYTLSARDTIDEHLQKIINRKEKLSDKILDEADLREDDVREILKI